MISIIKFETKQCDGCSKVTTKYGCVFINEEFIPVMKQCPCIECLVKGVCKISCQERNLIINNRIKDLFGH